MLLSTCISRFAGNIFCTAAEAILWPWSCRQEAFKPCLGLIDQPLKCRKSCFSGCLHLPYFGNLTPAWLPFGRKVGQFGPFFFLPPLFSRELPVVLTTWVDGCRFEPDQHDSNCTSPERSSSCQNVYIRRISSCRSSRWTLSCSNRESG